MMSLNAQPVVLVCLVAGLVALVSEGVECMFVKMHLRFGSKSADTGSNGGKHTQVAETQNKIHFIKVTQTEKQGTMWYDFK